METIYHWVPMQFIFTVIELPIRDGNLGSSSIVTFLAKVIELPIRDGN